MTLDLHTQGFLDALGRIDARKKKDKCQLMNTNAKPVTSKCESSEELQNQSEPQSALTVSKT